MNNTVLQRIRMLQLLELTQKNKEYADSIGVHVKINDSNKKKRGCNA